MELLFYIIVGLIIYTFIKKRKKEDDLVDFQISVSRGYSDEPKTKNKQPGKWIMPGETFKVGNVEIKGGFVYLGGQLKSLDKYGSESSLIDPTLKVNTKSPDYGGDQMGYWPSYSQISPESRAAYIEWLASNRSDPDVYIGYVFLYFYGIERRLLVDEHNDEVSENERSALIQELQRLKNIYGDNRSFNGYVTSLLSHTWVVSHLQNDEVPSAELLIGKKKFTSVFKFLLGSTINNGDSVTGELALAWVKSHPDYNLRTPARRCKEEFDVLFKARFKQKFSEGLKISPNKTRLQLDYNPASSSLRGYQSIKLDLPDVSRLKTPVRKIMSLAESCTDELESYSRFIGRPGNSRADLGAFSLLPNDLSHLVSNPQFERFKTWVTIKVSDSDGLVSVEELLNYFGEDAPLKINKKEAEMLSNISEKAGFGMAPDIRFHHAKPDMNGKVVFFSGGHGVSFSPSHAFMQVGTILRLGALVAGIDNHIDEAEVHLLQNLITQDNQLSAVEKNSLTAYMHWRLNTPANMTGLKARLENINNREKTAVSHILVGVALADGNIDPNEIKQLEKLYTSLGLDKTMVTSDIHHLSTNKVGQAKSGKNDEHELGSEKVSGSTAAFSLDRDLLKLHEEETQDVQAVLESIFVDESAIDEAEKEVITEIPSSSNAKSGLDLKHQTLYEKLITKEEWTLDEVKKLCEDLQLMTDGAIEVINDWAFDNVDAPLIEDGNTFFIDLELAEEIEAL